MANLKGRTVSSGLIIGATVCAKFSLNLIYNMALARLLDAEDFGLVAMVTAFTGILRVFKDAGLSIATIQREGITQGQVSNLFWINVAVSAAMTLVIAAAALPISIFYHHDSRLVGIGLLLSTTFLFSGTAVQHVALLNRQMRFRMVALIEVGSMVVSATVGITMGLLGFGYWSVVAGMVTLEAAALAFTWSASGWRPQRFKFRQGTRPLVAFGATMTLGNFVGLVVSGLDVILLGEFYGPAAAGLYTRAQALLTRPLNQLLLPMSSVFLPMLARLLPQPERYRSAFLRLYDAIVLAALFGTAIVLPLAHPLVLVLLGKKWEAAGSIFAGFTIAALYLPVDIVTHWLYTSQGRGKAVLVSNILISIVTLSSFLIGIPYGPVGVAFSYSISGFLLRMPITYYIAGRTGPVRTKDLWMTFLRHFPLWILIFLVSAGTRHLLDAQAPFIQLAVSSIAGFVAGAAFVYFSPPQRRALDHLIDALKEMKNRKRGQAAAAAAAAPAGEGPK